MRQTHLARLALAATSLVALSVGAQSSSQNAPSSSSSTSLPFGAKDDKPVSRWTPSASAGRQLSVNDLLSWKGIRSPQLSNDGKWFAYVLAPNEGDGEVVVRATTSGAKEMRFAIGDPSGGGAGGGRGAAAGGATVALSGNGKWVAFLV